MSAAPAIHVRRLSFAPNDPPACPAWGWGSATPCSSRFEPTSVLHLSRLRRSTLHGELAVVVHYPTHQVFDHLLTDHATLLARQFFDCLRDRINDFICFRGIDFV